MIMAFCPFGSNPAKHLKCHNIHTTDEEHMYAVIIMHTHTLCHVSKACFSSSDLTVVIVNPISVWETLNASKVLWAIEGICVMA